MASAVLAEQQGFAFEGAGDTSHPGSGEGRLQGLRDTPAEQFRRRAPQQRRGIAEDSHEFLGAVHNPLTRRALFQERLGQAPGVAWVA